MCYFVSFFDLFAITQCSHGAISEHTRKKSLSSDFEDVRFAKISHRAILYRNVQ